jgi:carboxypeptidase D
MRRRPLIFVTEPALRGAHTVFLLESSDMPRQTTLQRRVAFIALGLIGLGGSSAFGQLVGNPAGPRPGPVYELSLRPPDRAVLDRLNRLGFNIGHVTPEAASIFATAGEYDYLVSQGYAVTIESTQPAPPAFFGVGARGLGVYHSYATLTTELQAYAAAYPAITRLISLGESVQGRELWALLITDNPLVDEIEPEFKYVSTMHGDEPVGTETCLYFIDHLLTNYGVDTNITTLVNETAIWIVPLMNPDGLELGTRFNANGFDLNRSFPDYPADYSINVWNGGPNLSELEPEVEHLMTWSLAHSFVLSANFHTGAVVASYPYDGDPPIPTAVPAPTPDDALFRDLASTYASNNPPMLANNTAPFSNGTVNGNEWYIVQGGMQDWMYRYLGDDEITIELATPKRPSQSLLASYWNNNRAAMLAYLAWVHRGVRGVVTDIDTGDPVYGFINVDGNSQPVFPDPDEGDYYRLLRPGTYDLQFIALGYEPMTVQGVVVTAGAATQVDVQMARATNLSGAGPAARALLAALLAIAGAALTRKRIAVDS